MAVPLPAAVGLTLVLAAALWLHLPSLDRPFFADDHLFLEQVRGRPLWAVFGEADPLGNFFRPIGRQLYFWLIARVAGETPLVFHAVNLALFGIAIVLLFVLVRRLAGGRAGVIATGFLGLHYAADVPIRWASGSQEMLAVVGALAALLLHLSGRGLAAGVALLLGALCKETVLVTPLLAVAIGRAARASARRGPARPANAMAPGKTRRVPREGLWRSEVARAWPLFLAVGVWAVLWLVLPERRAQQSADVALDPRAPVAALAHLAQVALGLEWRAGEWGRLPRVLPPLVPLALVLVTVVWAGRRNDRGRGEAERSGAGAPSVSAVRRKRFTESHADPRAVLLGLLWALVGAAPVAAVAHVWSAYHYLYSMCGVALALGAALAAWPRWITAALVGVLAWGSASARSLDEFAAAGVVWSGQSHLNRFYIERADRVVAGYLGSLRRAHPDFPPQSTVFFAGIKGNVAFQTRDGPLLRRAYGDTSLRSFFLNEFSLEKARRGPVFFFVASGDTLRELPPGPELLPSVALGMMLSERFQAAREALTLAREQGADAPDVNYREAWAAWALGDTTGARASLRRARYALDVTAATQIEEALQRLGRSDTVGAIQVARAAVREHALDPGAHGLLADLLLIADPEDPEGAIEALAARALAPRHSFSWRRWAMVQAEHERHIESLASFERYFALAGEAGASDEEARRWVARIKAALPGGKLPPEGLRE